MTLRITLLYTVSTDGFIATEDHRTPFLPSSWQDYLAVCREFGHLIMGRKTFELLVADPTVNRAAFKSITVLSRSLHVHDSGGSTARTPSDAVAQLSERNISRALLLGGSEAATSFLIAGLLSEIHLDRNPVIFGQGIRMFGGMSDIPKLRLRSHSASTGGRLREVYDILNGA